MKRLIKKANYNEEYLTTYFEGCEINYLNEGVEITAPVDFFELEYGDTEIENCIDTNAKITFRDYDLESIEIPLKDNLEEELEENGIDEVEFEDLYNELNKKVVNSLLDTFENEIWK